MIKRIKIIKRKMRIKTKVKNSKKLKTCLVLKTIKCNFLFTNICPLINKRQINLKENIF